MSEKHWTQITIETAREVQMVDVSDAKIPDGQGGIVKELPAIALSGNEYFVLRKHRRVTLQTDEDSRNQMLGLLLTWMRLHKADAGLTEKAYFELPLETQLALVGAVDKHFGIADLGRSPVKNS